MDVMDDRQRSSTTTPKETFLVEVEKSADDVFLVSFEKDGCTFRGALLKVKPWSCPDIPRLSPVPVPSATTLPEDPLSESKHEPVATPERLLDAQVTFSIEPVSATSTPPEVEKKLSSETDLGNSDLAAIQHRWSYFEKNPVVLPRKNFTSKRERDRLDQVPKLRPRNFLCAKCKFALPGFSRAMSQQNANSASNQIEFDYGTSAPDNVVCTSPSHTRKGKIPLKRAAVNRPVIYDFGAANHWSPAEPSVMDAMNDLNEFVPKVAPAKNGIGKQKDKLPVTDRRKRRLSMEGLQKVFVPEEQKPVATILSPPSGDNGLKMKIKLSLATSPTPQAEDKPKRKRGRREKEKPAIVPDSPNSKTAANSNAPKTEKVNASDVDEEDDERPRLMIDDTFANDPADEPTKTSPTADEHNAPASGSQAARKKRAKATEKDEPVKKSDVSQRATASAVSTSSSSATSLPPVARAVNRCTTKDGRSFAVGDVVWGKLTGYPWWPGKLNHIGNGVDLNGPTIEVQRFVSNVLVVCDDPLLERTASAVMKSSKSAPVLQYQEAQIEWFGQKSSISYIEVCQLSHFVEDFEKKHKPKLRGSYQEAIKLASDAVKEANDGSSANTSMEEEAEEKDIFSELAAMEVAQQTTKTSADIAQNEQLRSTTDVYEFDTNDIYGRPSRTADYQPSSLDSST